MRNVVIGAGAVALMGVFYLLTRMFARWLGADLTDPRWTSYAPLVIVGVSVLVIVVVTLARLLFE